MSDECFANRDLLEEKLGYRFREPRHLGVALRHSSYAHEHPEEEDNERLEFLGDAVLGLVTAELLFDAHPDWSEGDLTRARRSLVEGRALAQKAREIDLGAHLQLGRTEVKGHGAEKDSILEDALEAVLGAMYCDAGLPAVKDWAQRVFSEALASEAPRPERDPKTNLQERVMARYGEFPAYELVGDSGGEEDDARFTVAVRVNGESWGRATARSKRAAEKAAAEKALSHPGLIDE